MADYLPAMNKRPRGRPPTNIRTHPNWPLLIELHEELMRAGRQRIETLSYQLAQKIRTRGLLESRAKWLRLKYRKYRDEIAAEVTARQKRAGNEAALAASLRAHQKIRRAIERAAAATVSLDQHPTILRLKEQQRELDLLAERCDPLRRWRHLLDE